MTAVVDRRSWPATAPLPAPPESAPQGGRVDLPGGGLRCGLVLAGIAVLADVVVALDLGVPVVRPIAGLYLIVALPTYLLLVKKNWIRATLYEALLVSVAVVVLSLMVGGLAINEILPLLGVQRPLDRIPVLVAANVCLLGLTWWRLHDWSCEPRLRRRVAALGRQAGRRDGLVLGAASLLVLASVAGAIRLNNGLGGAVTSGMLCMAALVLVALIRWRHQLRPFAVATAVYLLSLAMLLMTSLRGWGVVGHDSQVEFYVYQLTKNAGIWRMASFQGAYNACLSINILPTVLGNMTGISGAYVFKVLFPVVFALCPVIVYLVARRFGSPLIALLSAVYFVAFPTFFTDMPYLNRQAIAFLFMGMIVLVVTNHRWAVQRRQAWIAVLSAGVVLSHYSTTYLLIGMLVVALGLSWGVAGVDRILDRKRTPRRSGRGVPRVLGLINLIVLVGLTLVWTGPVTHSGGQVMRTADALATSLYSGAGGQQSSDVQYGLIAGDSQSPEQRLQGYIDAAIRDTAADRAAGIYLPLKTVDQYPTPIADPEVLPLTAAGHAVSALGVDVPGFNAVTRQGAARLLQVFVGVGLLFVLARRARGLHVSQEMFLLAVGAFTVVAAQVLLPALSVDYGVLRAFQQSLFLLAPILAVGSVHLFGCLGRRRAAVAASAFAVAFFLSLTGVAPQALGGYAPQLHLNNDGEYYDLYYTHPEEDAAADWVEGRLLAAGQGTVQTQIPGRLIYGISKTIGVDRAIDPVLVKPQDYVLLGSTTVVKGRATVSVGGDRITYVYPLDFLDRNVDLIYDNGQAMIFR